MSLQSLPPLVSLNSFTDLWNTLEQASCKWVMGKGRPVTAEQYSGLYQLADLSKRVMDIWHTQKMSKQDRTCLAQLNGKITEWYQYTKEQIGQQLCIPDSFSYARTFYSNGPNSPLTGDSWFVNKDSLTRGYTKEEWQESFPGVSMPNGDKISAFTTDPQTKLERTVIKNGDFPQEEPDEMKIDEDDWVDVKL